MYLTDFDGTAANTFISGPSIDVYKAYEFAVRDVLGEKALRLYIKSGGLKNRTPVQVVQELLDTENTNGNGYMHEAHVYMDKKLKSIEHLIPKGKGFSIDFEKFPLESVTELLVCAKLSYLMDDIGVPLPNGNPWPELFPGFANFAKIHPYGIISSGHESFIRKALEVNQIECPPVIITDDDMRGRIDLTPEERSKPSRVLIDLANQKSDMKAKVYMGDDPTKDGMLAQNAGITFGWFFALHLPKAYRDLPRDMFVFNDWHELLKTL